MIDNRELNKLRKEIDEIDKRLLLSLLDRIETVKRIADYKKKYDIPIIDQKRWKIVLNSRVLTGLSLGLRDSFITDIYKLIHKESVRIEKETLKK